MSDDLLYDDLSRKIESKIDHKLTSKSKRGGLDDGFKKGKVINEVLDKPTVMTLYKMISDHIIAYVNGPVSAGKESVLFWAVDEKNNDVALKIYLISTSNFKKREQYITGDPRFLKLKKTKFYQAGTSEMYGAVLETPQKETTQFNPQSPYACAKVYSHFLVKNYREGYGLFASNGILFNHESPRRGANFVTMKIINGVKKIMEEEKQYALSKAECIGEHESILHNDNFEEERIKEPEYVLTLGNIDSKRDWGHSKDYVYGMWLMLQQEKPGDYVLATGETYTVRDFIERSFAKVGKQIVWDGEGVNEVGRDKPNGKILVKIDEKYFRPCEVELLLGDASKAETELGWKREYNLDRLIDDMMGVKMCNFGYV